MNAPVSQLKTTPVEEIKQDINDALLNLCRFRDHRLEALVCLTSFIPENEEYEGVKPLLQMVSDELYVNYDCVFQSVMKLTKHLESLCTSVDSSERAEPEQRERVATPVA